MAKHKDLRELISQVSDDAETLADYMTQLVTEDDVQAKAAVYVLILQLLTSLRDSIHVWAKQDFSEAYQTAIENAEKLLSAADGSTGESWTVADDQAQDQAITAVLDEVDKALLSVKSEANRARSLHGIFLLFGGSLAYGLLAGTLDDQKRAQIISKIRGIYRNNIVAIIGKNGKVYHYSLDYYIATLINTRKREVLSEAAIRHSQSYGIDLVRVSKNPSTIGDYCDAYRGRVFSISGTSDTYPPLAAIPGGGCPMHPNCHHILVAYDGKDDFGILDRDFWNLAASGETNPNAFTKLWHAKKRK